MGISNATGAIVLTTGNKSELATGYSTLYGDSVGGFAVIKDVVKTLVYELCRHRNARAATLGQRRRRSPRRSSQAPLGRAATRPAATPTASRPTRCSTRCSRPTSRRTAPSTSSSPTAHDAALVARVAALVDAAEYKRRQMRAGRAHHVQGVRPGPPPADHQPLRTRGRREPDDRRDGPLGRRALPRRRAALLDAAARRATSRVDDGGSRSSLTSLAGQFAWHAELLYDLLPVRAGVDRDRLVARPSAAPTPPSTGSPTSSTDAAIAARRSARVVVPRLRAGVAPRARRLDRRDSTGRGRVRSRSWRATSSTRATGSSRSRSASWLEPGAARGRRARRAPRSSASSSRRRRRIGLSSAVSRCGPEGLTAPVE